MKKLPLTEQKKPSFFLFLSFSTLTVGIWIFLNPQSQASDPNMDLVIQNNWQTVDTIACKGLGFFEIDTTEEAREVYVSEAKIFISKLPMLEGNYTCTPILKPNLIMEIE